MVGVGAGRVKLACGTRRVRFPGGSARAAGRASGEWARGKARQPGARATEVSRRLAAKGFAHFALGQDISE